MTDSTRIDSPNTLIVVTFILALLAFGLSAYNIMQTRVVAAATMGVMTVVNRIETNEANTQKLTDEMEALKAAVQAAAAAPPPAEEAAPAEEEAAAE